MINWDWAMYEITRRGGIFWGNLSEAEATEFRFYQKKYKQWRDAWELIRLSHLKYGIPYDGPFAWLNDRWLMQMELIARKGWGVDKPEK